LVRLEEQSEKTSKVRGDVSPRRKKRQAQGVLRKLFPCVKVEWEIEGPGKKTKTSN